MSTVADDIETQRLDWTERVKDMSRSDLLAELQRAGGHAGQAAVIRDELRRRRVPRRENGATTTRRGKRTEALACLLSDGLTFNWFSVEEFDFERCRATVEAASPDIDGDYDLYEVRARDVVRGLRLFREDERVPKNATAWRTVLFGETNGEEGDYAAATADAVMQFAIYGEIVFESRSEAGQRVF
jgi:hypothetical protein